MEVEACQNGCLEMALWKDCFLCGSDDLVSALTASMQIFFAISPFVVVVGSSCSSLCSYFVDLCGQI